MSSIVTSLDRLAVVVENMGSTGYDIRDEWEELVAEEQDEDRAAQYLREYAQELRFAMGELNYFDAAVRDADQSTLDSIIN